MDEMIINSKLMKGILSKIIRKQLKKKLGCDARIDINSIYATVIDNTAHIHIDIDGEIGTSDLDTLISHFI